MSVGMGVELGEGGRVAATLVAGGVSAHVVNGMAWPHGGCDLACPCFSKHGGRLFRLLRNTAAILDMQTLPNPQPWDLTTIKSSAITAFGRLDLAPNLEDPSDWSAKSHPRLIISLS